MHSPWTGCIEVHGVFMPVGGDKLHCSAMNIVAGGENGDDGDGNRDNDDNQH